jgi:hypothetical protein
MLQIKVPLPGEPHLTLPANFLTPPANLLGRSALVLSGSKVSERGPAAMPQPVPWMGARRLPPVQRRSTGPERPLAAAILAARPVLPRLMPYLGALRRVGIMALLTYC